MICAIMQPTYNPWLGYFDLIDRVDCFVYLDNVQLVKRSWQVRNRIKSPNGELFLTIPIKHTAPRDDITINKALVNGDGWRRDHLKAIEYNYKKSKFFDDIFPFVSSLIMNEIQILSEFNINFIEQIKNILGIETKTIKSSDLSNLNYKKDDLLAALCKEIGADTYISPQGSSVYIDRDTIGGAFTRENIKLYYHNYDHPKYNQLFGEFLPYMGVLDLLFNEGVRNSINIIRSGRRELIYYLDFSERLKSI
ncbi:WbqC family protein [Calditerrivibrio sp.]|uniref:WbqC family protein n=1 Tax=Calditerrivibrio sp. TaxID=2792612 RepID=UPI003D0F6E52